MAKTTLKPWLKRKILVDIESTECLTKEEEEDVCGSIRVVFYMRFPREPWPSLFEIKQIIEDINPALANKLTGMSYH